MTSCKTNIVALAAGPYVQLDVNGGVLVRTATAKAVTATFRTRFRTATAAAWTANVGDYVWFYGEGAATGGGYYGYAVMSQKNATVDGVVNQDEYLLVGPWRHKNQALIDTIPPATATFSTYRNGTGAQPSPIVQSYAGIIVEDIVCPRNTTAGAGTLTISGLAATATGLDTVPLVLSVQTAATFSATTIPLPADGLQFDGPIILNPSANTVDWVLTWRGRFPIRNLSYATSTL